MAGPRVLWCSGGPLAAALLPVLLFLAAACGDAWGPEGGYPGTLDLAHNRIQPKPLRSWLMNESTACFFIGNDSAANSVAETAAEGRFGSLGIGWQRE